MNFCYQIFKADSKRVDESDIQQNNLLFSKVMNDVKGRKTFDTAYQSASKRHALFLGVDEIVDVFTVQDGTNHNAKI